MTLNRRDLVSLAALGAMGAQVPRVAAQTAWPAKPLLLVIAYAGGGAIDGLVRFVTEKVREKHAGWQFVMDYKPGATGNLGAEAVAKMAGDGHQFLVSGSSTHAANVHLYKSLPFDPERDFSPVTTLAQVPYFLVVNPAKVPVADFKGLVEYAKARPGQLSYGSSAITGRLAGEMMKQRAGIDIPFVPYKVLSQAVSDLIGGHLDIAFGDPLGYLPHVRSGRLRALAVTSRSRVALAPEVPTLAESGLADFDVTAWLALWARAGAPAEAATRLSMAISEVLSSEAGQQFVRSIGLVPMPGSPAQLAELQRRDTVSWGKAIRAAGIVLE